MGNNAPFNRGKCDQLTSVVDWVDRYGFEIARLINLTLVTFITYPRC